MDSRGRTAAVGHARPCRKISTTAENKLEQIHNQNKNKKNEPSYAAQTGE